MKVIGYYKDEGMGEFTLPTSGAIPEHGWEPVVLASDVQEEIEKMREMLKRALAWTPRDTQLAMAISDYFEMAT